MRLIVLVPLVALLNAVEESRLSHDEKLLLRLDQKLLVCTSSVLCIDKLGKFLLICVHALLLGVLEHLHRGVVEAIVVDNVEPDTCVQGCLLDLLLQAQIDKSLAEATSLRILGLLLKLFGAFLRLHLLYALGIFPHKEPVDGINLLDSDLVAHLAR